MWSEKLNLDEFGTSWGGAFGKNVRWFCRHPALDSLDSLDLGRVSFSVNSDTSSVSDQWLCVPHHGVKICGLSCNRISQHWYVKIVKICKEGNACSYKLQLIVVRYSLQFRLAQRSSQTCANPRYSESKFWAAQQIFALRMTLPRADANKSSQVIHRTPGVMVATCWQIFPWSQVTDM